MVRYFLDDGSRDVKGVIQPDADGTRNLGASGRKWATFYTNAIETSGTTAITATFSNSTIGSSQSIKLNNTNASPFSEIAFLESGTRKGSIAVSATDTYFMGQNSSTDWWFTPGTFDGSTSVVRIEGTQSVDKDTCLLIQWRDTSMLTYYERRVSVGASDSGGAGYRLLRVPNS